MVQVAAGILIDRGRVLACQRRATGEHPGKWEFPGGKREGGETLGECLRRELKEELGIDAQVGPQIWRTRHAYPGRTTVDLAFFLVSAFDGRLVNRAFAQVRWVRVGGLSRLDFLDGDREVVARLDRRELPVDETL